MQDAKLRSKGMRTQPRGVDACRPIGLRKYADQRGSLAVVEALSDIPFAIQRVYYLYDFSGTRRGGHAHKRLEQLFIAAAGAFDLVLDDGRKKKSVRLSDPAQGFYVCPMIWREIENFTPGAVCLVLASNHYDEDDYYRSYQEFVASVG
jgi:dTDP-4-dehydrorhamnose 3,5-epimerase-like enzyme